MSGPWTPKKGDHVCVWRDWPNRDGSYPAYGTIDSLDDVRAYVTFDAPEPCECGCGFKLDGDCYLLSALNRGDGQP